MGGGVTLQTELNELFARWKAARGYGRGFAADGPVEPERYVSEKTKILFVLKEPSNSDFEALGGLIGWLKDPASEYGSTWNMVARWAGEMLSAPIDTDASGQALRDEANERLARVAVMNVKKVNPQPRTDALDLATYAAQDADWIRTEIGLLSPDVIVGCGVQTELVWLLGIRPDELKAREMPHGMLYVVKRPGQVVLLTRHPMMAPKALGPELYQAWQEAGEISPG